MVVRMSLTVVAKEAVETALEGLSRISWFTQTPFPKAATNVTEVTEELTQNGDICRDRHLFIFTDIFVVADGSMARVEARHEDTSRWGANWTTTVMT